MFTVLGLSGAALKVHRGVYETHGFRALKGAGTAAVFGMVVHGLDLGLRAEGLELKAKALGSGKVSLCRK